MPAPPEQLRRGSVCLRQPSRSAALPELVLLLQDARRLAREEVMVAGIHVVSEQVRRLRGFYGRLVLGQHPAAFLIARDRVEGATEELYASLLTIAALPREDIVECKGSLTEEEMRQVSERLVKTLELDISR